MALSGTIGDFGLGDIFQLIGIQRKTGILRLDNGNESVVIKFLEGSVVEADTGSSGIEDRLGAVLVRTGKITDRQLSEALRIQKRTLQRLGHILVRHDYIDEDDLVEALRVQSLQIIYRLFRWRDGRYNMEIVTDLDYDQQHITPIASETILMEGARMIDEWPLIERRIRSDAMVFEKTESAEGLDLEETAPVEDEIDFDHVFGGKATEPDSEPEDAPGVTLSPEEKRVLALIDGEMTVEAITDHAILGDFDTQRILCELLGRSLIREIVVDAPEDDDTPRRGRRMVEVIGVSIVGLALILAAGASLFTLPSNPTSPWRLAAGRTSTERLRSFASHARLEKLEEAIQVHYLDRGAVPTELIQLVSLGYVRGDDLMDPWGRPYGFSLSPGGYQIFGLDAAGAPIPELSRSHRFSAAQRMVLESSPLGQ